MQDDIFSAKRNIPVKAKPKKKNDLEDLDIFKKKVKILGDGIKVLTSYSGFFFICLTPNWCLSFPVGWLQILTFVSFQSHLILTSVILKFSSFKYRLSRRRNQQERVLYVEHVVRYVPGIHFYLFLIFIIIILK